MKLAVESELTIDDLKKYGEFLIEPVMKTNLFTAINVPPYGQALILPLDLFNRMLDSMIYWIRSGVLYYAKRNTK